MVNATREHILVIEDEPDILELIQYNLEREGYRTTGCLNGEQGLQKAQQEEPSLILLDLMLPGLSGIEVCRRLKSDPSTKQIGVIMVSAKGEEEDVVHGLEVGADDYVPKPFRPKILLARVKAVLRRSGVEEAVTDEKDRLEYQGVTLDRSRHELSVDGEVINLTATEFRLLFFLASHPGRVFTRNQLLDRAIGANVMVIDRNIDVHVGALRKKLGNYRGMIETVRGVGYRFKDA